MSIKLEKIVLYSHKGQMRELKLNSEGLSIITGASKTGKSALIDIIDYCFGRGNCHVADGVIRKYVSWYGVLLSVNKQEIFIARRNPLLGEKTSSDVYFDKGASLKIPEYSVLTKNINVEGLIKLLSQTIGISENEQRPSDLSLRFPYEANIKHSLLFCFQDQDEIDSRRTLFHRQSDTMMAVTIRELFPYFLGAVDEDSLLKRGQLDNAKRQLRQIERQLKELQSIDSDNFPRAKSLFKEAQQAGLISEREAITTYPKLLEALKAATSEENVRNDLIVGDADEILNRLRLERKSLRADMAAVKEEILSTRLFASDSTGYEREIREQHARLSSIGLIKEKDAATAQCPVCDNHLDTPIPAVTQMRQSLQELQTQLSAVAQENPRMQGRLIALEKEEAAIEERLRENMILTNEQIRASELLKAQQDSFIYKAQVIGRIQLYLDTVSEVGDTSDLEKQYALAQARVDTLEKELDPQIIQERMETYLNIIGKYITEYSNSLNLEHAGSQLRLDVKNLTVVADTLDGPVPLSRMGSGENWVGYHVLVHLAIHKWFRQKKRPIPAFVIFDQPSQAHYPPEKDAEGSLSVLKDEDQDAVYKLFKLISNAAQELFPEIQFIVLDHADLKEPWFEGAVVQRWRGGNKLVPLDWIS